MSFQRGLELCEENANRLFEKMHEVSNHKHYLSAFYLGTIALEEYGKAFLILENWDKDEISKTKWKKQFTHHLTKMRNILKLSKKERVYRDKKIGIDIDDKEEIDEHFLKSIIGLRDVCRYVDFNFEEGKWNSPMACNGNLRSWSHKIAILLWWANRALKTEKNRKGL